MKKIFIDPGHGGSDPGALGKKGTRESDIALKTALLLGALLTQNGFDVGYSRESDVFVGLSERARMANNWKSDFFVSLHCNSYSDPNSNGTETFAYNEQSAAVPTAKRVQERLIARLCLCNRGVKFANFAVLRETNMPAILAELAFISNANEEKLLNDAVFREKAANALFEGITGKTIQQIEELTGAAQIVRELSKFGIVGDVGGMVDEIAQEPNGRLYWLARKLCHAIRLLDGKPVKNTVSEYEAVGEIVWDLAYRKIVSDKAGMTEEMNANPHGRLYWLARKGLDYLRRRDG
jgi:hypothetical protein